MTGFYRELKAPGRCMWWGLMFTILFFVTAWGTDIKDLYGMGAFAFIVSGVVALVAAI